MPVTRQFLGWDAPLVHKVCDVLLAGATDSPVDLGDRLVVVSTRQAGRRLRQALAVRCGERGTGLLSPQVVAPADLLRSDQPVAPPSLVTAVWIAVLREADVRKWRALFPVAPPAQDLPWASHLAESIQNLRANLAEGGTSIAEVLEQQGSALVEADRWADLAKVEKAYLDRMKKLKWSDPCVAERAAAQNIILPEGVKEVIVAGVPDLSPLVAQALERIGVRILIHAPENQAHLFDEWGRPLTEAWDKELIPIPEAENNVRLAGSPAGQSRVALQMLDEEAEQFSVANVAIGVPDPDVTPYLAAALAERGHKIFDPAGRALAEHPLFQLLDALRGLVADGNYADFSGFVRHYDVLAGMHESGKTEPANVLCELDDFQNMFLPPTFDDIANQFRGSTTVEREYPNLFQAVRLAAQVLESFNDAEFIPAVRSFLQRVYALRQVNPAEQRDEEFLSGAGKVNDALAELESAPLADLEFSASDGLDLLVRRLRGERYYPDHNETSLDLEGWLELAWNDAPLVIVTGVNEGILPDSRISDVFLPDKLRVQLGLRNEAQRCARDAFLLRSLLESRSGNGRVCLIAGKTSSSGDPLRPSRLLFRCGDKELPARCRILFGDAPEQRPQFPATATFQLNPMLPGADKIETMRVTAFRSYLVCPFRFYLSNSLGMESADDRKSELDELDFGTMVHEALERLYKSPLASSENEQEIAQFLAEGVDQWLGGRFGDDLTLQMRIQGDAAQQRLRAAARVLAQSTREGWELIDVERNIKGTFSGMEVRGRIDRIERHRTTGIVRLLDFKSSDRPATPVSAHTAAERDGAQGYAALTVESRPRRWTDLQLPLYRILLEHEPDFKGAAGFEIGYFNLPKAVTDTRVEIWDNFNDALRDSARDCAEGVIRDIQNGRFWPPAENVMWDEFESLFFGPAEDAVVPEAAKKLAGKTKGRA